MSWCSWPREAFWRKKIKNVKLAVDKKIGTDPESSFKTVLHCVLFSSNRHRQQDLCSLGSALCRLAHSILRGRHSITFWSRLTKRASSCHAILIVPSRTLQEQSTPNVKCSREKLIFPYTFSFQFNPRIAEETTRAGSTTP